MEVFGPTFQGHLPEIDMFIKKGIIQESLLSLRVMTPVEVLSGGIHWIAYMCIYRCWLNSVNVERPAILCALVGDVASTTRSGAE